MVRVDKITYSRDATVQAFRDYFQFLVAMYLDESDIVEPPEDGWATIPRTGWPNFDKTDKVIDLLRHISYLDSMVSIAHHCELIPWHCTPADQDGEDIKEATEPHSDDATIPPHIVGLTAQSQRGLTFLLDTEFGVIYWYECESEATNEIGEVEGDAYDWLDDDLIAEDQVEWRASSRIWEISDFFEMLKTHFRNLTMVPLAPDKVRATWYGMPAENREELEDVQKIYREHGWPDLERYRKNDCLAAIKAYLQAREEQRSLEEQEGLVP